MNATNGLMIGKLVGQYKEAQLWRGEDAWQWRVADRNGWKSHPATRGTLLALFRNYGDLHVVEDFDASHVDVWIDALKDLLLYESAYPQAKAWFSEFERFHADKPEVVFHTLLELQRRCLHEWLLLKVKEDSLITELFCTYVFLSKSERVLANLARLEHVLYVRREREQTGRRS